MPMITLAWPDGRRLRMPVSAQVPLWSVLQQAASRLGADPAAYELRRGGAALDLSLPFGSCGVPNNGLISCVARQRACAATVHLAVVDPGVGTDRGAARGHRNDDSARVQLDLSPMSSVWAALVAAEAVSPELRGRLVSRFSTAARAADASWLRPVVLYDRREIGATSAEALWRTRLVDLGLRSGSGVLRLARYVPTSTSRTEWQALVNVAQPAAAAAAHASPMEPTADQQRASDRAASDAGGTEPVQSAPVRAAADRAAVQVNADNAEMPAVSQLDQDSAPATVSEAASASPDHAIERRVVLFRGPAVERGAKIVPATQGALSARLRCGEGGLTGSSGRFAG